MCIKQTSNRAVISASQSALAQHKGQNHRPGQAHMLARSMFLRLEMALESSGRTRQTSARAVISTLQGTGAQHNGQNHRPGRAHMLARSMFLRLRMALESSPWQMRAAGKSTVSRNATADTSVGFWASSCGVLHGDTQPHFLSSQACIHSRHLL